MVSAQQTPFAWKWFLKWRHFLQKSTSQISDNLTMLKFLWWCNHHTIYRCTMLQLCFNNIKILFCCLPFLNICSCWLPSDKGMIFAFVGPMIAIIVVRSSLYYICTVMHGWAGHLQLFLSILTYCVLQWITTHSLITELNYAPLVLHR